MCVCEILLPVLQLQSQPGLNGEFQEEKMSVLSNGHLCEPENTGEGQEDSLFPPS